MPMKRYSEYNDAYELPSINFKIIADTEDDKQELLKAFKYIHDLKIDSDYIVINQLAHLYQDNPKAPCRIIVM